MIKRVPLDRLRNISRHRSIAILEPHPIDQGKSHEQRVLTPEWPIAAEGAPEKQDQVTQYSVYADCGEGGRMSKVYTFKAPDDVAAKAFVVERLTGQAVELWSRSRRVACIDAKKQAGTLADPGL